MLVLCLVGVLILIVLSLVVVEILKLVGDFIFSGFLCVFMMFGRVV